MDEIEVEKELFQFRFEVFELWEDLLGKEILLLLLRQNTRSLVNPNSWFVSLMRGKTND